MQQQHSGAGGMSGKGGEVTEVSISISISISCTLQPSRQAEHPMTPPVIHIVPGRQAGSPTTELPASSHSRLLPTCAMRLSVARNLSASPACPPLLPGPSFLRKSIITASPPRHLHAGW
jgi:hypothetical protein